MLFPKLLSFLAILFILAAPLALSAHRFPPKNEHTGEVQLVPCSNKTTTTVDATTGKATTKIENPCDFLALMHLVRHLIDFVFFLAMPVAAALFAYAGWLYLSSSASPGNIGRAHGIFWSVLFGLLWVLGAWLVIKLISDALLKPDYIRLGS